MYVCIVWYVMCVYVTKHRKRDDFGQKFKTKLLVPPYKNNKFTNFFCFSRGNFNLSSITGPN